MPWIILNNINQYYKYFIISKNGVWITNAVFI